MNRTTAFAALATLAFTLPAFAGDNTPRVDKRQAKQEHRIEQGIASGELTEREANRLERRDDRIEAREAHMKADGTVTRAERARLHHALNKESRAIKRQKHDGQN
ncbi:hypothetical protein [Chitinimonas sp. BJYL2]|uniref:hypothetical protein n=1 Tax=Chitinimonas sp. BJYL2 TaxID=2976696 RepID=UPI0022B55AE1|nr:hypothetical protein [Chitinimonas sp. BJYL2]